MLWTGRSLVAFARSTKRRMPRHTEHSVMGDAPFRLLDVVLDELAQAQARARGHRSHSAADVAPDNPLKTKEGATGATGATQKRLTACTDLNDRDACAWSRNT